MAVIGDTLTLVDNTELDKMSQEIGRWMELSNLYHIQIDFMGWKCVNFGSNPTHFV